MTEEIFLATNIKCAGCASAIENGLGEQAGIASVTVDVASGQVIVRGDALDRAAIAAQLQRLGYPEANA